MSEYKQVTGVGRLRVRGFDAVRYCATLKAAGVNLFRAAKARRARMLAQRVKGSPSGYLSSTFGFFKEQIVGVIPKPGDMLIRLYAADDFWIDRAA